jgi:hypothetical protein
LSFVIAFDAPRWYARPAFAAAAIVLSLIVGCIEPLRDLLDTAGARVDFLTLLTLDLALLFVVCMICHGELVRRRPLAAHLTEFYLMIAAGGALGGMVVTLVCPVLFATFLEWPIGLVASFLLGLAVFWWALPSLQSNAPAALGIRPSFAALGVVAIALAQYDNDPPLEVARNFYGVVSVYDRDAHQPPLHHLSLRHGIVVHGRQFVMPEKRDLPVAYYAEESGVGHALKFFAQRPDLHVGAIGLGVGTNASYAQPGQRFRFYEINPEVHRLAEKYFTYLSRCRGDCQVVLGDARLSLEQEPPQGFHVLVLDAFSGDAVPTHLLTREAFGVYLRHLRDDGVIAINITNHHLDLAPVVEAVADQYGLKAMRRFTPSNGQRMLFRADWLLLSRNQPFFAATPAQLPPGVQAVGPALLWTDDYSNLFQLLK